MSTTPTDPANTRNMAATIAEIKARVDATEQAKKENLIWFSNYKDVPTLDDRLTNFSAWQMAIKDVCDKQNCLATLESEARKNNRLDLNNSKNVNLRMSHSISDNVKVYVVKKTAYETYMAIDDIRPKPNEQRVAILEKVNKTDTSDIREYVRQVQTIQTQLIMIDPERNHHESKAPAHMTRILDNLSDDKKTKVLFLRVKKWRSRDQATDREVFLLGDQLIEILGSSNSAFANAAMGKDYNGKNQPTSRNPCGIRHNMYYGNKIA